MPTGNYQDATRAIYKWLVNGATKDMSVDGSTPVAFVYTAPVPALMNRAIIYYRDGGVWTEAKFGSLTALTNGVMFEVHRNGASILDLFDGLPLKTNSDMSRICFDNDIRSVGSGESYQPARFTFQKAGQALMLRKGDSLVMTIQDNLAALSEMYCMVQGYQI